MHLNLADVRSSEVDFMVSRRSSNESFASEGERLFFSAIFSMIVVFVQANLLNTPIFLKVIIFLYLFLLSECCQGFGNISETNKPVRIFTA